MELTKEERDFLTGILKRMTVQAATSYDAQRKAALLWGIGRRSWDVTVMRADAVHDGAVL